MHAERNTTTRRKFQKRKNLADKKKKKTWGGREEGSWHAIKGIRQRKGYGTEGTFQRIVTLMSQKKRN